MGSGIAESVAVAGLPVVVRDVDEVSIKRAGGRIEASLARAVSGGKLDAAHADVARGRIELTTDLEAIAGADLVVLYAVCDSLYEEFKRDEYAPPLLKRMVAAGRLGRKSGRGFYEYV